ncbi:MAG: cysteine synthase A [Christensenella sp.]|nr:cysteine synthase A [Christensenella sp.]
MGKIFHNVTELIGHTPIVELERLSAQYELTGRLLAKLENLNPAGSVKDRTALSMIEEAENAGALTPGATIIEPTSGNTGIGLAAIAAVRGYRVILTMPETMSEERRNLLKAYGAEIVLTPGQQSMQGAIARAVQLAKEIPGSFIPGQFENPANPLVHERQTGPEIWEDTEGKVDIFIAGVGTGGTLSGVGHFLKKQDKNIKVIAVEPLGSPVLSQGRAGAHGLQGLGAGFIPQALDTSVYDEVIAVADQDAYRVCREIARTEGILSGISSGAAVFAAIVVASRKENRGKTIVTLLPDTGERYLSTPVFQE